MTRGWKRMKRITRWHRLAASDERTNEATKLDARTKKKKDLRACKWRRGRETSRREREAAKMERIKRSRNWLNMHEGRFGRLTVREKIKIEQWRSNKIESERIRRKEKWNLAVCIHRWKLARGNQRKNKGMKVERFFFRIVILKGNYFNTFSFFQGRIAPGFH